MFKLIEEIWKGQKFLQNNLDFSIPDTIYLDNTNISWYFNSQFKNNNQILKKKSQNSQIDNIISYFKMNQIIEELSKSKCIYTNGNQNDINQLEILSIYLKKQEDNQNQVGVKYLNKNELAVFLLDYKMYPHLYKDIILHPYIEKDKEFGRHLIQVTLKSKFQSVELKSSISNQIIGCTQNELETIKINIKKQERLIKISKQLVQILQQVFYSNGQIQSIQFQFKQQDNKFLLISCQEIKFFKYNQYIQSILNFQQIQNFLHNYSLYNQFQQDLIIKQLEAQTINNQIKLQCAACLVIVLQGDTFDLIQSKILQIRLNRKLFFLQEKDRIEKQRPYDFVKVCKLCYDTFLNLFSEKNNQKQRPRSSSQNKSKQLKQLSLSSEKYQTQQFEQKNEQNSKLQESNQIIHNENFEIKLDQYSTKAIQFGQIKKEHQTVNNNYKKQHVSFIDRFDHLIQKTIDDKNIPNKIFKKFTFQSNLKEESQNTHFTDKKIILTDTYSNMDKITEYTSIHETQKYKPQKLRSISYHSKQNDNKNLEIHHDLDSIMKAELISYQNSSNNL